MRSGIRSNAIRSLKRLVSSFGYALLAAGLAGLGAGLIGLFAGGIYGLIHGLPQLALLMALQSAWAGALAGAFTAVRDRFGKSSPAAACC